MPVDVLWSLSREPSRRCVAVCDTLGITVEGRDQAHVCAAIPAAQAVLLDDLRETGDLEAFLAERAWALPEGLGEGRFTLSWCLTAEKPRGDGVIVRTSAVEVALRILGYSPIGEVAEWVVSRHPGSRRRLLLPQAAHMDVTAAQSVLRHAGLSAEGLARFTAARAVPAGVPFR